MTTARDIITDAYRENNITAIGVAPTDNEFAEGLRRLNNIQNSLFGQVIGLFLRDWEFPSVRRNPEDSRYPLHPSDTRLDPTIVNAPPQNARVVVGSNGQDIVYFAQNPDDGAQMEVVVIDRDLIAQPITLDANSRAIIEGSDVSVPRQRSIELNQNFNGPRKWFFRADLGTWVEVPLLLTLDTHMFLPPEFDDYFITALNIRLSGRNSNNIAPSTSEVFADTRQKIKNRYWQREYVDVQDPHEFNTYQSYNESFFFEGDLLS